MNLVTGYYAVNQKSISDYILDQNLGLMIGDLRTVANEDFEKAIKSEVKEAHYLRQKECMQGNSSEKIKSIFESLNHNRGINDSKSE
jgi:hypothetical protein